MIKTRAKDLRGVAASSRIAEAIIAFACAQNRLPALIPLSSNWHEEVGWFLFIWAAPWLNLAVYNWWRAVIKSCLGLDTQPARSTKPKPTNCSHHPLCIFPFTIQLLGPDRFLSTLRSFTIYKRKTDFCKIIYLQTCQINHNLQPLLWNGVAAFNESVHGGQI